MSVCEHRLSTVRQGPVLHKPRVTVAQLFLHAVQQWWQRRKAIQELQRLDDRLLKDIGLTRNDIPRMVEELSKPSRRRKTESPATVSSPADRPLQEAA